MYTSMHAPQYVDSEGFKRDYSLSPRTFFLWIKEGKLTAYKPSKRKTLVKRADIERLLEASKVENDFNTLVDETVREVLGK